MLSKTHMATDPAKCGSKIEIKSSIMPNGISRDDPKLNNYIVSQDRGGGTYYKLLERYNGLPVYFREEAID